MGPRLNLYTRALDLNGASRVRVVARRGAACTRINKTKATHCRELKFNFFQNPPESMPGWDEHSGNHATL